MMELKENLIKEVLTPCKLIFGNRIFELTKIDKKFIIKNYIIKTVDEKIDSIFIKNPHPNAKPRTGEFCIPNSLRKLDFNKNTLQMIRLMLCCFNLDDCYFTPWNEIEYRKQEVTVGWKIKAIE